ncbi:AbrB/MazE/SpoVT family DNA-binding domain-containing protein, partial [Limosilactobacillus reuteri]
FQSGNSSAVRLNKDVMEAAGFKANDPVKITVDKQNGRVIIKQDSSNKKYHDNFSDLLNQSLKEDREILDFLKDK